MLQTPFLIPFWRGSCTQPNSSAWFQMFQTSFLIPITKGKVLSNKTAVLGSKCCKRLFSFPLEGRSFTQLIYSARLQTLQTFFLIPIRRAFPNQIPVHDSKCLQHLESCTEVLLGKTLPLLMAITLVIYNTWSHALEFCWVRLSPY